MPIKLFGTSGIRGEAKTFLKSQFCFDIGRVFAKFLKRHRAKKKVALGMDPRSSSQRIKKAFARGLLYEKIKVIDEGIVPVPAMNWILIKDKTLGGSVMITGSHIREDHNGLKFFFQKKEILKKHEREIEEIYEKEKEKVKFPGFKPLPKETKAKRLYLEMLLALANLPYPEWKVVLDLGNGCQAKIMPTLFKKLKIKTYLINDKPSSKSFIARDTETEDAVSMLQKEVKKRKADFGIAFDGDGDRVVFVDEKGNFIPGDYSGSIIAKYSPGDKVVVPINASQVVEYIGKKVIRTKVGSPYVVEAMEKYKVNFGFEANGGGISREIMLSRDGGSTAIKMLNILKKTGKKLSQLVNEFPRFFLYRTKVDCPSEFNQIILKKAKEKFKGKKIEEIDGIKIWVKDTSWILFRPSSNAPEFRVFAEAKTKGEAEALGRKGIEFVKSIIKTLQA